MDVKDSTNITGISRLINYDGDRNLEDLEKGIIEDINDTAEITDVEQYKQQLEELGNALGVSLDDEDDKDDDNEGDVMDEESHPYEQRSVNVSNKYNSDDIDDMFNKVPSYKPRPNSYMERVTEEQKKQKILTIASTGNL